MSKTLPAGVDLERLTSKVETICLHCDYYGSKECQQSKCLAGFALKVLAFAKQKNLLDVPGASNLIPANDFKPYDRTIVVQALAETCRQCKECRDNHNPDCVVALVRTSIENTVISENIIYPGSVFLYMAKLKEHNPELAGLLAGEMSNKK